MFDYIASLNDEILFQEIQGPKLAYRHFCATSGCLVDLIVSDCSGNL